MSKGVDGLRGDAFVTAKEIGPDKLWQIDDEELSIERGVDIPIKAVKDAVFPLTTYEAQELFRQFC